MRRARDYGPPYSVDVRAWHIIGIATIIALWLIFMAMALGIRS
jgi:hypothetical protein